MANPYRPGAGRRPPTLAGRDELLADFDIVCRRATERGESDRSWVLTGLRGVGKTALLNEFQARVGAAGWIVAKVEVGPNLPIGPALAQALVGALRTTSGRHSERRLRRLFGVFKAFSISVDPSGSIGFGIDVEPIRGIADSGRFADDLSGLFHSLGETARDLRTGVLILIDELQEASPAELAALNTAVHQVAQASVPVPLTVIGAGLPSLPVQLAGATSYAERLYEYRSVGPLDAPAVRAALVFPAREHGIRWTSSAVAAAAAGAGGYPYFVQAIGKHVWDHARRDPIGLEDVEVGLAHARREIDDGLYRVRWERATPAQRDLLRALARCAADSSAAVADVVTSMGRSRVSDISVARNEVIRKGLVYAPERGLLAFTVPGMHEFVLRQE